jgi:glutathione S-transferase
MSCSFTLHVFPPSPNGRKVLAVAHHLGLKPEIKIVDLTKREQKAPEFLAINPNGKNPALTDGDLKLWESNAIIQYMSERYGDSRLWGSDARSRADVSRWMFWESAEWLPSVAPFVFENMVKQVFMPGAAPDQESIRRATERFHPAATVLSDQLGRTPFVCGAELTLADFALAALLTYWQPGRVPLDGYENIKAWLARMNEVPAWKQTTPQLPSRA